jgi:non-heme chloroperoxidase
VSETILMIHGMCLGGWCWDNYRGFFEAQGHRCITPTLRHHDVNPGGIVDPRLGITSLLDYARDLEAQIRKLDRAPILIGHSMGGLLAQILASRGLGRALILLTPAPPYGIVVLRPTVIRSYWSALTTWGFWKKSLRQTFDEAAYSIMHLLPPDERRAIYEKFVHESGRAGFEMGFWFLDRRKAAKVEASKINCPVLVIGASQDRIVRPAVARKVARKYRHASTYKEFSNHAHWLIGEPGWCEVADFIAGWLQQTLRQPCVQASAQGVVQDA